ncbi:hypothetical protein [Chryseobacterium indologenes]|uniref:Uncharacterized protein n=1 Tax=Chryseobacterium indologenes TaxID=253 RepID=A0A0N0ZVU8_CHRID|nr:hypothetical protein [Chryseobacterium indologenes]KPE52248.1 hypothetical protein AOB46_05045 [Chryseobacterium indologenes]
MEEGGWKLILVIGIESLRKIKYNKNRSIFVVNDFHNFPLPSSSFKPAYIRYSYPELRLITKRNSINYCKSDIFQFFFIVNMSNPLDKKTGFL